jgi:hypothetical protein
VTGSFRIPRIDPARPDFNGDGRPDIIWRNIANGATYLWNMNGPSLISDAAMVAPDSNWTLVAIADFNGDRKPDMVWRHNDTGATYVWYMDGVSKISEAPLFALPPVWQVQGVADFNGDGRPDFLIRNADTGLAFLWFFSNAAMVGDQYLFNIDPSWIIEGVTDFNGDEQPDLLFRNTVSGLAFIWQTANIEGQVVLSSNASAPVVSTSRGEDGPVSLSLSTAPLFSIDPAWEVVQTADWNGDGMPDLLFRNRDSGVVFVWYLNGTSLGGSAFIIQIDPSWEIVPR